MKKDFIFGVFILFISMGIQAQTFEYKNSGTDYILMSMSAPSADNTSVAFAGGSKFTTDNAPGIVIKTEDAGETWETVYEGDNIQTLSFATSMRGFAAGYSPTMKKTIDGGVTWEEVTIGSDVYAYMIVKFYNENIGMTVYITQDYELEVRTTTDGGESWNLSTTPPQHGILKVSYGAENTLYAVGYSQTVYKSIDGGDTWNIIKQGGMDINLSVAFRDAENGVYVGEEGDLYVTHDGGDTWSNPLNTGYHHFYGLLYKDNYILASGTDEAVYISNDNGESFEMVPGQNGPDSMYEIILFEDNTGLICGSGGTMIKFSNVLLATEDVVKNSISIYPNPTSNTIQISTIQKINQIELLDLSGKLIFSKKGNNLKNNIDLTTYPKGVYILNVNSEGVISTHRIIKK